MASNFEILWPTDPKFSVFKDLNFFSTVPKVQEATRILGMGFALSKWPHLLHKLGFVDSLMQTNVYWQKGRHSRVALLLCWDLFVECLRRGCLVAPLYFCAIISGLRHKTMEGMPYWFWDIWIRQSWCPDSGHLHSNVPLLTWWLHV